MNTVALMIYTNALRAMQDAEEMGGPEGASYDALMHAIAAECEKRIAARRAAR